MLTMDAFTLTWASFCYQMLNKDKMMQGSVTNVKWNALYLNWLINLNSNCFATYNWYSSKLTWENKIKSVRSGGGLLIKIKINYTNMAWLSFHLFLSRSIGNYYMVNLILNTQSLFMRLKYIYHETKIGYIKH